MTGALPYPVAGDAWGKVGGDGVLRALPLILSIVCEFLQEIDHFICQAKERGYESLVSFGKKSINVAATAAIQVAAKVT